MKAIAAMAKNRVIGKDGGIPWRVIDDFKWFKEFTMGNVLVVGRTTFESLPPLKGRSIIVLSSDLKYVTPRDVLVCNCISTDKTKGACSPLLLTASGIEFHTDKNVIVSGGAIVYQTLLPFVSEFYVTHINGEYEGDTYMPKFEHLFDEGTIIKTFDGGHVVKKYTRITSYEYNTTT